MPDNVIVFDEYSWLSDALVVAVKVNWLGFDCGVLWVVIEKEAEVDQIVNVVEREVA